MFHIKYKETLPIKSQNRFNITGHSGCSEQPNKYLPNAYYMHQEPQEVPVYDLGQKGTGALIPCGRGEAKSLTG